mmetsp:Transcript_28360/g.81511  ORF Transcript_28360/g.81511 Transcript_28360/m.81511 type:complete len:323 (+) Transcript_28360:100-1068(+)|eukprot:CAMPEP_0176054204 /NCGR_PEP_ID=MMETSP0120_2-20121206/26968_1 /TAXON_ID=160619 /ORGANISM="Kryptoperidinium foliaceum, Strain CCMP 1326" /LENGTH=322 /DNA_ID=CAMNT_0017387669 /DNA_START=44 /DNA_END=1012 /DNA_ORIENTATION=-
MSWFASGLDTFNQLSEKVQNAIPAEHKDFLAKLTLNTEEMKAERQQFGAEEKRKQEVKDMLAGMLPWETRDSERDILVDECKEAILALSSNEETFFGPYEMPDLKVNLSKDEDEEVEEGDEEEVAEEEETKKKHNPKPSDESREKLAKLEPLPPLLRDFDLDSHVGLIERLFKEDPKLQQMQSHLSGGGPREKVFWHNYFFHCAYTRYEAGLSIDEIWSYQPEAAEATNEAVQAAEEAEEEVVFADHDVQGDEGVVENTFDADEVGSEKKKDAESSNFESQETSPSGSASSEFEMLDEGEMEAGTDPELDELEAEIARELED